MKKGFTLIELLAVIVILAIIALIATPIVLNIISDTKESAQLRSAEMYLKGVETSVATATLNNKTITEGTYEIVSGDICLGTIKVVDEKRTCNGETLNIEINGEAPTSGKITIDGVTISSIELNYKAGKTIVKNSDGDLVYQEVPTDEKGKFTSVCKPSEGTEYITTAGAKYSCEVKKGTSYNFYVLTTPAEGDTTINLIMDQNVNSDGTPAGMTGVEQEENAAKYNIVRWISESTYGCGSDYDLCATNEKGPITAMQFLYNATKDWTNIEPLNYTYNDREYQGIASDNTDTGYTSFISTNGVATITSLDKTTTTTIGSETEPLRARMPIYAYKNGTEYGEVAKKTDANAYLYDNIDTSYSLSPYGYWTFSSNPSYATSAWKVLCNGTIDWMNVSMRGMASGVGVRPVINLRI